MVCKIDIEEMKRIFNRDECLLKEFIRNNVSRVVKYIPYISLLN